MLKKNVTSIRKISKSLHSILSNLNNFHSLEVEDRGSETQLQVSEKYFFLRFNPLTAGAAYIGVFTFY